MATKKKKKEELIAHFDRERRTCLETERSDGVVSYIPLDVSVGLEVVQLDEAEFDRLYKPIEDYPIEKACDLFLGYSQTIGATEDVLDKLGLHTKISKKEREMATSKKGGAAAKKPGKKAAAKKTKAATKAKKGGEEKATRKRGPSAASRFRELIMEGKKTDDQIFAIVQKEFGLDDNKRSYVKWYRNDLAKKGEKVPEPK